MNGDIEIVVKLLRDNGVDVIYSCKIAMIVEAKCYGDVALSKIYDLLIENGYDGFVLRSAIVKKREYIPKRYLYLHFPYTFNVGGNDVQ